MTMHLERGLTTTSNKKHKAKITKSKQAEFERGWRERNIFLKSIQLPKETFEQYMEWLHGKGRKEKGKEIYAPEFKATSPKEVDRSTQRSNVGNGKSIADSKKEKDKIDNKNNGSIDKIRPWNSPPPTAEPAPTYTGSKMIGITVLHKSCLQPIFSQEEAKDAASMRR